jgi:hypothetical protein
MAVMIVVSLLTAPPPREKTEGIIWSRRYAALPDEEKRRYHGWKDFRIWWALFVAIILAIYAFFAWRRIEHPWRTARGSWGFGVRSSEFGDWSLGFGDWSLGVGVLCPGFGVLGFGF